MTSPERQELTKLPLESDRLRQEPDTLAKAAAWFATRLIAKGDQRPPRVFEFMRAHQAELPIASMAPVPGVSVSSFYAWRNRPASAHATSDASLLRWIRTIRAASHGTYGAPWLHAQFQAVGTTVARERVAPLMRGAGLHGVSRYRLPTTTGRKPRHRPANDLIGHDLRA